MRKRNNKLQIYLSDEELQLFDMKAQKAGMSRAELFRKLICGCEIKELPPVDFFELNREMRRIGSNIEQLLRTANAIKLIDAPLLRKALDEHHAVLGMMWNVFVRGDR